MNEMETAVRLIQEKAEKYSINGIQAGQVLQNIQDFKIKIALVGAFSAGKSALLNAFLGRDVLEEDQRPETAIASELLYGTEEFVEAITDAGVQRYALDKVSDLDTQTVNYLRWHLNSPALKELQDYVLIDMPGFNSGIKGHNKAILRYAEQANAYLLVIDAEDGGIKQSVNAFLNEVRNYEDNVAITITKSDLKTGKDLELIEKNVAETASDLFCCDMPVITTYKFDEDVVPKLRGLIARFDRDSIFRQAFQPTVYEMGSQVIGVLEVLKKNATLNTSDLEEEIRQREQAKKQLSQKLQNEQSRLSDKLQNSVKPAILADAENTLYQQADALARSLESGGANFSMLVNNILRPVLVTSTNTYIENSFDEFISGFSMNTAGPDADSQLSEIADRYKEIVHGLKNMPDAIDKYNGGYKGIMTALAVTTSAVAPWLELVIIFLPDIVRAFSSLFQQRQEDKIHTEVCNSIIPQIIQKLNPEISKSLTEMEQDMTRQLEEKLSDMIDLETSALENAKEQIAKRQASFRQQVSEIDADVMEIRAAIDAI